MLVFVFTAVMRMQLQCVSIFLSRVDHGLVDARTLITRRQETQAVQVASRSLLTIAESA